MEKNHFNIRQAKKDDMITVAKMNKQLIRDEGSPNPMTIQELERRFRQWRKEGWRCVVIEHQGTMIGYCVFKEIKGTHSYQYNLSLKQFFIRRHLRSRGIGSSALKFMINSFFPKIPRVRVEVLESNQRGKKFWLSNGFVPVATTLDRVIG